MILAIYDTETGRIKRVVENTDDMDKHAIREGEEKIELDRVPNVNERIDTDSGELVIDESLTPMGFEERVREIVRGMGNR